VLVLVLLFSGAGSVVASASDNAPEPEQESSRSAQILRALDEVEFRDAWDWLETRRDNLSENVSAVGRNLDDWLAGEFVGARDNQSYLRLRLNQRVGRHTTYTSNARISGRIDLPQASERWQLIFESENQERSTIGEQRLDHTYPSSVSGGFRYALEERGGWQFSHDVGLRARIPLDPFYRFRTRYGVDLAGLWRMGLHHRVSYYHNDGWGQDARVFFTRDLTDSVLFRASSEAKYHHTDRITEFAQYVSIFQSLGELETMTYEIGVIGMNRPTTQINSYYAQMAYRRAIHEDWLVMELAPQLLTKRAENWRPDPRVQFTIEVYFFDF